MLAPTIGSPSIAQRFVTPLQSFSPVAMRLMTIIFDEDVKFKEVAKLIQVDPSLSGQVLRLANSGLYGRSCAVHSILHAVALVGMHRVIPMVITAAMWKGLPRRNAPFVKSWWRHSVGAALTAVHINHKSEATDRAYTASLLHGIGQMALYQHSPALYEQVLDAVAKSGEDLLERERKTFGADHAELGSLILQRWNLPYSLSDAAAAHHKRPSSVLLESVQAGCIAAEYTGFGQCGWHRLIASGDFPPKVADLVNTKFLPDVLAQRVNELETSLA